MATNLYKGVDAQADLARRRASQSEQVQLQGQRDALARRAAQLGGGPSGAMIKQENIAADQSAQRLGAANEGIEAARMGEHGRIAGVLQGQEFSRGERIGAQNFASREALAGRNWQTNERVGTQNYQSRERVGGQNWQSRENALNRDELARQFDIERDMAEWTNLASTVLSAHNSGLSPEVMGQLFAALGIDIGNIPGLTSPKGDSGPAAPAPGTPLTASGTPVPTTSSGEPMVLVRVPGSSEVMYVPQSQAGSYTRA